MDENSAPKRGTGPRRRTRTGVAVTLIIALLGVVAVQSMAQSDPGASASPDFVGLNGQRIYMNADGSYEVEVPGQGRTRALPGPAEIHLEKAGANRPSGDSAANPSGNLSIVQFATQPIDSYRAEIRQLGGRIGDYIPDHALLVMMDEATTEQVAALPYVVQVIPYDTDYRATAATYDAFGDATPAEYAIKLFDATEATRRSVSEQVLGVGGRVTASTFGSEILRAQLTGPAAADLMTRDLVQFIELLPPPAGDTARERAVSGADWVEAQGGYDGTGVTVGIFDNGVHETHEQFTGQGLTIVSDNAQDTHGTAVTSIIIGNGTAVPNARGVSPGADAVFVSYLSGISRLAHASLMTDPAGPYRAVVAVSPWGNGFLPTAVQPTVGYSTASAELDEAVFQHELLTVQSMGNASGNQYRPQASAKNVLSVGAIGHLRNLDPTDDTYSPSTVPNLAGTGPITDGRIKPDVHFWNDGTPAALHDSTNPGDNGYYPIGFDGTSAAAAVTTGYMALFYEMWADGVFLGTPGLGRDVFNSRPRMATAKALAINTAGEYAFSSPTDDKNRWQQGWGRTDAGFAYDLAVAGNIPLIIDETDLLAPFDVNTYTVDVGPNDATNPCYMRTTMVYTDPAAAPGATIHRVNDLSLRLTSPSGVSYWGNNGLTSGNESTSGGSPNTIDTVENVFLATPEPGTWTIEVFGDSIVSDSHVETAALDADYALISSGLCVTATPPPVGSLSGTIFQDDNGDGISTGESGLGGVGVTVTDAGGTVVATPTTDSMGNWSVASLPPGTYTVTITGSSLPADLAATADPDGIATPNTATVAVTASTATTADFGYQVQVVSVGNRVYVDTDFSGTVTGGDSGPPSPITVELRSATGSLVQSTVTDADGYYLFDRVTPGSYRVVIPRSETIQTGTGGAANYDSTLGQSDPDDDIDLDDNSFNESGLGLRTPVFTLAIGAEPTGDPSGSVTPTVPDANANMTVDLGLFPAQD